MSTPDLKATHDELSRLSRDGFSATDLGVLERLRAVRVDVASEVARLFTPNS